MSEAAERAQADRYRQAAAHGVESTYFDNLGEGWRMSCLCGFTTGINLNLQDTGEEMDTHFEVMKP